MAPLSRCNCRRPRRRTRTDPLDLAGTASRPRHALAAAAVTPSNNGGVDEGGGGNGGGSSGGVHDVNNANVENVENFFRAPTFSAFAVSGRVAVVGLCKKLNPVDP